LPIGVDNWIAPTIGRTIECNWWTALLMSLMLFPCPIVQL